MRKSMTWQTEHTVALEQVRHPSGHLEQLPFVETNIPDEQDKQTGVEEFIGKSQVIQKGNAR